MTDFGPELLNWVTVTLRPGAAWTVREERAITRWAWRFRQRIDVSPRLQDGDLPTAVTPLVTGVAEAGPALAMVGAANRVASLSAVVLKPGGGSTAAARWACCSRSAPGSRAPRTRWRQSTSWTGGRPWWRSRPPASSSARRSRPGRGRRRARARRARAPGPGARPGGPGGPRARPGPVARAARGRPGHDRMGGARRRGRTEQPGGVAVIVCVPVTPEGEVDPRWGRAARVAVARLEAGRIAAWDEHAVAWDVLHDVGTEGGHHARVAAFLQEHGVEVVVAGHMGPPMVQMLGKMRIVASMGAGGNARVAVEAAGRLDA